MTVRRQQTPREGGADSVIPLFRVFMPRSVMAPLRRTLFSGYVGEGPRVEEFERELGPWLGTRNVLALNNGTSAIWLALRLAGVGPGDEVISTPMTCAATNEPVLALGARIVWADIDPWTGTIAPEDVARRLTRRTKAVLCMHWGGYPCDLDELNALARSRGIALVEDACHAFGSTYRGRPVGSRSDFACFSFQAIKEMTTVDGGALTCRSRADRRRGRLLRWYGIDRTVRRADLRCEADIREYGYKFHMNDVTATIGLEQLRHVAGTIARHRAHAAAFDAAFAGLAAVRTLRYRPDRSSAHWLYTLRVRGRDRFRRHMAAAGITVSQVHSRNDAHTVFRPFRRALPGVDEFAAEQVSIPVGWWLRKRDVARVIAAVLDFDRTARRG
jgi:dTDP-4-amino-4,6-dideoxygalactose transaminase